MNSSNLNLYLPFLEQIRLIFGENSHTSREISPFLVQILFFFRKGAKFYLKKGEIKQFFPIIFNGEG
jgi:hypothetical protein